MSTELIAAVGLCAGLLLVTVAGGGLIRGLGSITAGTIHSMSWLGLEELDTPDYAGIIKQSIRAILLPLSLVTLPAILVGAAAGYLQAGFHIASEALKPDITRFDPIKGWGRLFSLKGAFRTALAATKVLAIGGVMATVAWSQIGSIIRLGDNELGPMMVGLGHIALKTTLAALAVIVVLGVLDLLYQRWQHERDLRMTKQEVKEENRLTDGDPKVKARIRKVQLDLALKRMMADVPEATVVVTNPTHYAVALKYERDEQGEPLQDAPVCVAKGADFLAQRIKLKAAEADVVCYEDVPLARALYAQVEIGDTIPEELYAAVAVVLGHVYQLQASKAAV